ncbi:MAG: hypothetical protein ACLPKT_24655, partial [Methylocella sp.]
MHGIPFVFNYLTKWSRALYEEYGLRASGAAPHRGQMGPSPVVMKARYFGLLFVALSNRNAALDRAKNDKPGRASCGLSSSLVLDHASTEVAVFRLFFGHHAIDR